MNVGVLDRPSPPFPSSRNGATEEGEFLEVPRPGCRGPCAASPRLPELSGPGCRGRARSVHPRVDPQPTGTAEPFGLRFPVPRHGLRTCPDHTAGERNELPPKGSASPGPGQRCDMPFMGVAARALTAEEGFSSVREYSKAGLERVAGRERCFHCEVSGACGRSCR